MLDFWGRSAGLPFTFAVVTQAKGSGMTGWADQERTGIGLRGFAALLVGLWGIAVALAIGHFVGWVFASSFVAVAAAGAALSGFLTAQFFGQPGGGGPALALFGAVLATALGSTLGCALAILAKGGDSDALPLAFLGIHFIGSMMQESWVVGLIWAVGMVVVHLTMVQCRSG